MSVCHPQPIQKPLNPKLQKRTIEEQIDLEASLDSGRLTNVEFKVRAASFPDVLERSFRAHKQFLAFRSGAFEAIFFGDLAEGEVANITDVHPKEFDIMLRYLYSGCARIGCVLDALHARAAARKYLVASLVSRCTEYIRRNLVPSNLFTCFDYYSLTGKPDMDTYIPGILQSWTQSAALQALSLKEFAQAKEHIVHFLLDNIRNVREIQVATAVRRWAQEQCVKSSSALPLKVVMRPFFPKIRFLAMTTVEFLTGPDTWGIMHDNEALCVLRNIVSNGAVPLPPGFCDRTQSR